jgi:outer membrane protein assembly factor BamB
MYWLHNIWGSWDGLEHATHLNGGLVWSTDLGQTIDTSCAPSRVGVASTAAVATVTIHGLPTPVVFVGGGNAHLYALNANTGTVIWKTFLGSSPSHFIWGSPAIDENDGSLYFATGNKSKCSQTETLAFAVVKLRASDLTLMSSWQVPVLQRTKDSDFGSTPTLFQATIGGVLHKLVGVANKNGIYYAFDRSALRSGPIWQATLAIPGPCPERGDGSISPGAWDGSILYAFGM